MDEMLSGPFRGSLKLPAGVLFMTATIRSYGNRTFYRGWKELSVYAFLPHATLSASRKTGGKGRSFTEQTLSDPLDSLS
jgi:hypothetical protein